MRPRACSVAAAAAVLVAAGCGGGEEAPAAPSPEQQVRATLFDYRNATAARDERRLCDELLSQALVGRIERAGLPCEQALEVALEDVREPVLDVDSVRIRGDEAEARVRSGAEGQAPSEDVVRLVREDGRWRITSLGGG